MYSGVNCPSKKAPSGKIFLKREEISTAKKSMFRSLQAKNCKSFS